MKNVLVSLFCAAVLMAPAFAGGDCCSKKTSQAAPTAATCAKDGETAKSQCCKDKANKSAEAPKASCCTDKQAKAPEKACKSHADAGWMMEQPKADCSGCQSASL